MHYDYSNNENKRMDELEIIIHDEPYNWKRHLLFDLPDIILTIGKWLTICIFLSVVFNTMTAVIFHIVIEELPGFCEQLK